MQIGGGASRIFLTNAYVSFIYLIFISEIYSVFERFENRFSVRFVTGGAEHKVFLPESSM